MRAEYRTCFHKLYDGKELCIAHTHRHADTHTHTYIYIYIYRKSASKPLSQYNGACVNESRKFLIRLCKASLRIDLKYILREEWKNMKQYLLSVILENKSWFISNKLNYLKLLRHPQTLMFEPIELIILCLINFYWS